MKCISTSIMNSANRYIVSLLIVLGVLGLAIHGQSQWTYRHPVPEDYLDKANAGDSDAQLALLKYYWRGVPGVEPNEAEAYKWAFISASQGNNDAQRILDAFDDFLSEEDREKGRALAKSYLANREQESGHTDEETDGGEGLQSEQPQPSQKDLSTQPDDAPEPPPAAAVLESSETMNAQPESKAPADGGGR